MIIYSNLLKFALVPAVPLLAVATANAQAPTPLVRQNLTPDSIPPQIRQAIANAPPISIFNIGTETLDQNVIIADKVVFNEGALAQISRLDWPYVIIYGKEFLFSDPEGGAQLLRTLDAKAVAPAKPDAPARRSQAGRDGRHGKKGLPGAAGQTGAVGQSLRIPDIWLITNRIGTQGTASPTSTKVNLRIHVPGIMGSVGGDGGNGGVGQQGGSGRNGEADVFGACESGAGGGGDGGRGGSGGKAGDGGAGGSGGNVFYVGPTHVIDVLQFASVKNNGAQGGAAGKPGSPGSPGKGGSRGSHPGSCSGPGAGGSGPLADPAHLGQGSAGAAGLKGSTIAYVVDDVSQILTPQ